jgi:hypothetical protein
MITLELDTTVQKLRASKKTSIRPGTVAHTYNFTTQEVKIGRIMTQDQPWQKVSNDSISINKWGTVVHTCCLATWKTVATRPIFGQPWAKMQNLT